MALFAAGDSVAPLKPTARSDLRVTFGARVGAAVDWVRVTVGALEDDGGAGAWEGGAADGRVDGVTVEGTGAAGPALSRVWTNHHPAPASTASTARITAIRRRRRRRRG